MTQGGGIEAGAGFGALGSGRDRSVDGIGIGGRGRCGVGSIVDVVEKNGAPDAVVAAAHSKIRKAVLIAVAPVAACASFPRKRGVSFDVFLWYGHGT